MARPLSPMLLPMGSVVD